MKLFFGPVQIGALLLLVAGLVVRQPAITVLGAVLWVGAVAIASMRKTSSLHQDTQSLKARSLLQPLIKLREEITKLVADNTDNATVRVIGADALSESEVLLRKATAIDALIKESNAVPHTLTKSENELTGLKTRLENTTDDGQRETLVLAIQARESEIEHYSKLIATIDSSKQRLQDAEVALRAIKAQLAAAVVGGTVDGLESEELGGMVSRLKSLSSSIEEVEEMREPLK